MFIIRTMKNTEKDRNDKFDVKELLEFERFCRDNAQWDEMRKCFAQNSHIKISWFEGTGDEFVTASQKMESYAPHKINDTLIWVHGDRAIAIMMATIQIRKVIAGVEMELQSDAKLVFRTQRINSAWYIATMEGIYEKDSLIPVYPAGDVKIPAEEISKYRSSYAGLSYVLATEGYEVNSKLPGRDCPETVVNLYEECTKWLYAEA